jgi:hypothetical protein
MTRDDIIGMAREAGIDSMPADYNYRSSYYAGTSDEIERFAALVAAAEREACALECERVTSARSDAEGHGYEYTARDAQRCAAAIRARGQA